MARVMTSDSVSRAGRPGLLCTDGDGARATSRPRARTMRPRRSRDPSWCTTFGRRFGTSIRVRLLLRLPELLISRLRTLARGATLNRLFGIPGRSLITPRPDIHGPEERNANIHVLCELSVVCGQVFYDPDFEHLVLEGHYLKSNACGSFAYC